MPDCEVDQSAKQARGLVIQIQIAFPIRLARRIGRLVNPVSDCWQSVSNVSKELHVLSIWQEISPNWVGLYEIVDI